VRRLGEIGQKCCFWGGGIEAVGTLNVGTPEQIRRQVFERLEIFSPGGGFVFNTVHNILPDVPPENFWANDILWQLSVLAYNISVMMRQRKNKFKQQEHRSFIDWFIVVPAKITISGHQIESTIANANKNKQFSEQLRMYEHHFYKADWEELDRLIEAA
jgi:hypothetical protein